MPPAGCVAQVGHSFAMANATAGAKAAAATVLGRSNDEDGVAEALLRCLEL